MKREVSAGGIVYQDFADGRKFLIIQNSRIDHPEVAHWGFPKGHLEQGENTKVAALREVLEETNITAEIIKQVGESNYIFTRNGHKINKIVTLYLMKYLDGEPINQESEISEVRWADADEALSLLTFPNDKKLLKQALVFLDPTAPSANTADKGNFVSRGGLKLDHALTAFDLDVSGKVALDVGSSTGGFVDCLLQRGIAKVYALDTAYGEFAWKLRQDPRVVVMERTNILHLESLPEPVDLVTIDAGWTKLDKILPVVKKFLKPDAQIIALLKPHYEAEKRLLVNGVLPDEYLAQIKSAVTEKIESLNLKVVAETPSPILGGGGNTEFLLLITKSD